MSYFMFLGKKKEIKNLVKKCNPKASKKQIKKKTNDLFKEFTKGWNFK